jgi:hypothetical protein
LFESVSIDIMDLPISSSLEPQRWLKSMDEVEDHVPNHFRASEDMYNNFGHVNARKSLVTKNSETGTRRYKTAKK